MKYRIEYTAQAEADLDAAFVWIGKDSPRNAAQWRKEMIDSIESLSQFPKRCPLAAESQHFQYEIRQLIFGKRHGCYRILFTIIKHTVYILHIRHSALDEIRGE